MSYQVLQNYNRNIVLQYHQTPKVTKYLEITAFGPQSAVLGTQAFKTEYYQAVAYSLPEAIAKFLELAQKTQYRMPKVIFQLKEMLTQVKEQA